MKRTWIALAIITLVLAIPTLTWAYIKPARVLAPQWIGLTCVDDFVCVDDISRLDEARTLYADAIQFVETNVGQIDHVPQAIFCSGKACSSDFGLYEGAYGYAGAYNVATFGFVISYRGWAPYYVRHELIHHLQNERLGSLNAWFFKPDWFKEGMAYSLSEDPRRPLPDVLEAFRVEYETWAEGMSLEQIWLGAEHF